MAARRGTSNGGPLGAGDAVWLGTADADGDPDVFADGDADVDADDEADGIDEDDAEVDAVGNVGSELGSVALGL